ncbi:hypothetical protein SAMN05444149_11350 [Pseudosulfitobacter pseudonitzschiae]|uniref:Tetratricopeptide repeat protein n=1 Tax=Pseudosulfitobacter pseudonitzschiae TaxID=1402135 RepID=A0A073IXI2_9RHOB|nr:hypothetical protein [Pseudosulfitobacter pseudonitzschiae]KEJ94335.1 hypothetical protein SUH3_07410 [Pseudosulfitobacter pseudonitzschiae]QKS11657.1 hypothetical protein HT745_23955 [Pseudosulfitobacter pseudonitzschiae]SHG21797.1 hypothetical protein SAMN05444149_11350 [Pseudosulfitobacter pseudonitzschiae]
MIRRRVIPALLALMLAQPVQGQSPADLLNDVDRILADGGGLALDVELTRALRAARAEGPLGPDWAQVMVVTANLIATGLCKAERALDLYDSALTVAQDAPEMQQFVRIWRAYTYAYFGRPDLARADLDRVTVDPATYLERDYAAQLQGWLAGPVSVSDSPGFLKCTQVASDAADLFNAGDLDQARSLLIGLNLPEVLAQEPLVRISNLSVLSLLAVISGRMGQDDSAVFDRIITDLSVPDVTPPTLRPDMVTDAGHAQMVADVLDMVVNSDRAGGSDSRRATAQRWLDGLAPQDAQAQVRKLSFAVNDHRIAGDWHRAAQTVQALLALPDLDADLRAMAEVELVELQSYIAVAEGRPVDHIALANAFRTVFDTDGIAVAVRVDVAGRLVGAFDHAGHGYLAHVAGIEVWQYMRDVQRATAQAGDSVAGQGKVLRATADITIADGFDVAAQPPDGTPPPPGLCQEVVGIELCTIVLQQP